MSLFTLKKSLITGFLLTLLCLFDTFYLRRFFMFSPERLQELSIQAIKKYPHDTKALMNYLAESIRKEYGDSILPLDHSKWFFNNAGNAMGAMILLHASIFEYLIFFDLIGNVYARFKYEEDAQKAVDSLNSRWYAARPVYAELSPVTDFREACCRQHETSECMRGGFCNFMHSKKPSPALLRDLELSQKKYLRLQGKNRSPTRSPSPIRRDRRR
ncbi:hypothetical protein PCK2_000623 [Pneumocystis canis]|nr:hypothetical protein PCK2_000623 [Pneumocystis canis]